MIKEVLQEPFKINGISIQPGVSRTVTIPLPALPDQSAFDLRIKVIHGRRPGKRLFISSTIHGDELNGIETIRQVMASPLIQHISGTLVLVPIVNLFGVIIQSRYLPDNRDLNRSFPGNENGSASSQLANIFLEEIVMKCTHGIDLHTGSNHRKNLPQVRCDFESEEAFEMAKAFGAPVVLKAAVRDGSLREACEKLNIPTLTYEGGESLRFNDSAIRYAVQGIFKVMRSLDMIHRKSTSPRTSPVISHTSRWLRSPSTGIFRTSCELGRKVEEGDVIGQISDMLGERQTDVVAHIDGIVIGRTQLPIVYKGDALFNIAWVPDPSKAEARIEELEEETELNPALNDPMTY